MKIFLVFALLWNAPAGWAQGGARLVVGSKKFTESVVLGEIAARLAADAGAETEHQRQLGGTRILWNALLVGELDVYPEYTGTLEQEIFAGRGLVGIEALRRALAADGIGMGAPLGFNNTYAIGLRREEAARLGVVRISDLRRLPQLRLGFSNEFLERGDGWPSLKKAYGLPQTQVRGLDHDLAYRGLESGGIDAIDLYSTDAEIRHYDLAVLEDDLEHFPAYRAVFLYRLDLVERAPRALEALLKLGGRIPAAEMVAMNARAKLERQPEAQVAADFLRRTFGADIQVEARDPWAELAGHLADHLALVALSLAAAVLVAVPLGIAAARSPRLGQALLGAVAVVQTVPSLALFVFMIPLLGIGGPPAVTALFLYSLLPIVRNTYTGLRDIPPGLRESAVVLGLPAGVRLRQVELPLALRPILAGIKTAAVINVGTATLAALIGAGGLGQPILTGIRLDDTGLILQGAVPAALLALAVQGAFEGLERLLIPRGLRLPVAE